MYKVGSTYRKGLNIYTLEYDWLEEDRCFVFVNDGTTTFKIPEKTFLTEYSPYLSEHTSAKLYDIVQAEMDSFIKVDEHILMATVGQIERLLVTEIQSIREKLLNGEY